jgi:hypothetical protein
MEVYDADTASGVPSNAGVLSAPVTTDMVVAAAQSIVLDHVGGNEGIYISAISLGGTDAADFLITTPVNDPFLLPGAGSKELELWYTGTVGGASASLDIAYSGGMVFSVDLTGTPVPEPSSVAGLAAGVLALAGLSRRRGRQLRR